eukprot:c4671_g1_i1.p1 GENE.c4671_g1_i1~~c4671_g1_i1.p1  ORF type:complete len:669 (-),score=179.31 c4671_g1_i1:167-2173(-)
MSRIDISLENMLPDLTDFYTRGIFSQNEIKSILKTRTQQENLMQGRLATKHDYLRAIQYEMNLMVLKGKRKRRLGIQKATRADFAVETRIHALFRRALQRFQSDKKLWLQYLDLCVRSKSRKTMSKTFAHVLRIFPTEVGLWIYAASFEFEMNLNMTAARALLQRGIRVNPTHKRIWREYMRLECLYALKLRERREILGIDHISKDIDGDNAADDSLAMNDDIIKVDPTFFPPPQKQKQNKDREAQAEESAKAVLEGLIPKIVFQNAMKKFSNDAHFAIELANIPFDLEMHPLAVSLVSLACDMFPGSTNVWEAKAKISKTANRLELYQSALEANPCPALYELVANHLFNLLQEEDDDYFGSGMLLTAEQAGELFSMTIEKAFTFGQQQQQQRGAQATAKTWKLWISFLVWQGRVDEAFDASKDALTIHNDSFSLHKQHCEILALKFSGVPAMMLLASASLASKDDTNDDLDEQALGVWKEITQSLDVVIQFLAVCAQAEVGNLPKEQITLWQNIFQLLLFHAPSLSVMEEHVISRMHVTIPASLLSSLLMLYLEVVMVIGGPSECRHALERQMTSKPIVPLPVLLWAVETEEALLACDQATNVTEKYIVKLLDYATARHAKDDGAWLRYLAFELRRGNLSKVNALTWKASREVENPGAFLEKYNQMK